MSRIKTRTPFNKHIVVSWSTCVGFRANHDQGFIEQMFHDQTWRMTRCIHKAYIQSAFYQSPHQIFLETDLAAYGHVGRCATHTPYPTRQKIFPKSDSATLRWPNGLVHPS